ncbi:flagellin [Sporosarcina psychrophila]|uniref:flagellin N-terminal helical domain-containing protein n=1 Tax=Sporosarcina psychrophila TaxID=1476 RepID=UPI00078CCF48|nr:flagellin [Sporosarcina psychrophila]AMQ07538.1 hypothetical protein AZE41_17235 [Sporosarcina psychrophila]
MRINHNIAALNTHRQLNTATTNQSKSMEKLASGLRINKAGDDAAGLAISEKMRGQIRGLDQASKNAQDGISMIATAEGALNETHDILQRMRELSVQSSNDTNTDADRESIQTEIGQLKEEIDRIGNTTEFNTKKLIDGSVGQKKLAGADNAAVISSELGKETAANAAGGTFTPTATVLNTLVAGTEKLSVDGANIEFTLDAARVAEYKAASASGTDVAKLMEEDINKAIADYNKTNETSIKDVTVGFTGGKVEIQSGSTGNTSTINVDKPAAITNLMHLTAVSLSTGTGVSATGSEGVFSAAGAASVNAIDAADTIKLNVDGTEIEVKLTTVGTKNDYDATTTGKGMDQLATDLAKDINDKITAYNATVASDKALKSVTVSVKDGAMVVESGSDKATSSIKFDNSEASQLLGLAKQSSATQGGGVDFQIGANQTQAMKVTIEDMRTDALGIKDVNLSTKEGAQEAITKVNAAIEKVSAQRSNLGAFQNRLDHTINNLNTSSENLTAAESRIRDVDMAKEMMEQTKNSILLQAAQAMLAQANQQPQGVLQLLR